MKTLKNPKNEEQKSAKPENTQVKSDTKDKNSSTRVKNSTKKGKKTEAKAKSKAKAKPKSEAKVNETKIKSSKKVKTKVETKTKTKVENNIKTKKTRTKSQHKTEKAEAKKIIPKKTKCIRAKTKKTIKISWDGIPAFTKRKDPEDSLRNHFMPSIYGHIVLIVILSITFTVSNMLGINHSKLLKSKEQVKDITFVLGGSPKYRRKATKAHSNIKLSNKKTRPKTNNKNKQTKKQTKKFVSTKSIISDFSIPIPKIKTINSGRGGKGTSNTSSSSSSDFGPYSSFSDSDIGGGSTQGRGSGSGQGFDKVAAREALKSFDMGPYVNELKRNIRWNWRIPKSHQNKKVELFLRIARDGKVVILNVKNTAEIGEVDEAALEAVRRSQPLSPLPSGYKKGYFDIIFILDPSISSVRSRY